MRPGLWAGLEVQKLPSLMPGKASACTGFAFATYCCSAVLRRPDYQSVIMQLVDPVLPRRAFALLSCPSVANEAHSSPSHALVLADACTKGKVCICWCVTAGSVPPAVMHHHCLSPSSPLNAHPQFLLSSTPGRDLLACVATSILINIPAGKAQPGWYWVLQATGQECHAYCH